MWSYTLLFGLQIFTLTPPVSGEDSVTAKLHDPVTLTCDRNCSGLLQWTPYHKQSYVVSQCDQSSCRSEVGFNISHEQYLKGEPYLTVTAADYSNAGIYRCHCEGEVVCEVDLNIETQKRSHVVTPGEPIDVHLPLTDLVEVSFTPSDAVQPSNLQICTMKKDKLECNQYYQATVSHLNILQIKVVNVSHSGTYTVRDLMKNKTIAIVEVEVRVTPPVSGEYSVTAKTAKLHDPVTLTCDWNCSGLLQWTPYHKQTYVVSQCDQSSCWSEVGFNISHDQYLKGEPYLTITAADYSNTGIYSCHCEGKVVCEVDLNIEKETCIPVWAILLTVILLIIIGSLFIYQCIKNQQLRAESASNRPQHLRMTESNNERQQSRVTENTSHNPGDEGISEETALNKEQQ